MTDQRPAHPSARSSLSGSVSSVPPPVGGALGTIPPEKRAKTVAESGAVGVGAALDPRPLRLVRRGGVIEDLIRREVAAGTRMPTKKGVRP